MDKAKLGKIGVLMGGPSSEREISLKSGKAVCESLRDAGCDVVAIDIISDDSEENMRCIARHALTCAFIALHGRFGEDGQVQRILDAMHIPYTGSGARASGLAMDKCASRRIFSHGGLTVPPGISLNGQGYSGSISLEERQLSYPVVVKPASHGSSIGITIVEKAAQLDAAIRTALQYDEHVLIEQFIDGRELTVGILGSMPLPVIEIIPKTKFFDYTAKYQSGMTEYRVPAQLDETVWALVQREAVKAHELLGCRGCSRVDFILTRDAVPYILEINTIPGMTATSLLPKAAKEIGIDFTALCLRLIESAYEKEQE